MAIVKIAIVAITAATVSLYLKKYSPETQGRVRADKLQIIIWRTSVRFFSGSISDSQTEEQDAAGKDEVGQLKLDCPAEPVGVTDACETQCDQKSRVCGIYHV